MNRPGFTHPPFTYSTGRHAGRHTGVSHARVGLSVEEGTCGWRSAHDYVRHELGFGLSTGNTRVHVCTWIKSENVLRARIQPESFKPSLRDVHVPEDPHVNGPRGGSESCD